MVIYGRGSPRAQVIDAVLHPDKHDVRAAMDGLADGRTDALSPEQKLARSANWWVNSGPPQPFAGRRRRPDSAGLGQPDVMPRAQPWEKENA